LGHDLADQIAGQQVRPDFLVEHGGRLATQHFHLQRLLDGPEVEFDMPAIMEKVEDGE